MFKKLSLLIFVSAFVVQINASSELASPVSPASPVASVRLPEAGSLAGAGAGAGADNAAIDRVARFNRMVDVFNEENGIPENYQLVKLSACCGLACFIGRKPAARYLISSQRELDFMEKNRVSWPKRPIRPDGQPDMSPEDYAAIRLEHEKRAKRAIVIEATLREIASSEKSPSIRKKALELQSIARKKVRLNLEFGLRARP